MCYIVVLFELLNHVLVFLYYRLNSDADVVFVFMDFIIYMASFEILNMFLIFIVFCLNFNLIETFLKSIEMTAEISVENS